MNAMTTTIAATAIAIRLRRNHAPIARLMTAIRNKPFCDPISRTSAKPASNEPLMLPSVFARYTFPTARASPRLALISYNRTVSGNAAAISAVGITSINEYAYTLLPMCSTRMRDQNTSSAIAASPIRNEATRTKESGRPARPSPGAGETPALLGTNTATTASEKFSTTATKIVVSNPKRGISTNPASATPVVAPNVLTAYNADTAVPFPCSSPVNQRTSSGNVPPIKIVGGKRKAAASKPRTSVVNSELPCTAGNAATYARFNSSNAFGENAPIPPISASTIAYTSSNRDAAIDRLNKNAPIPSPPRNTAMSVAAAYTVLPKINPRYFSQTT